MKIVLVDNFNRDEIADYLVCENIDGHYGELVVNFLNGREHDDSPNYFMLKEDDYVLSRGILDLI